MNDFFVNLFVTDACNFKCRYCYEKDIRQNKTNMSKETADDVIQFIADNISLEQKLIITFHGGEPLLQFDLIRYIIDKIHTRLKNEAVFGITTNGSLLTDDMVDYLVENMKYKLSISLDGDEKTQSFNRPMVSSQINHKKIMDYAALMNKKSSLFTIRMTYDRKNIRDLFRNIRFFIDRGFDRIIAEADFMSSEWEKEDFDMIYEQFVTAKKYVCGLENRNVTVYPVNSSNICLNKCTAGHNYYSISTTGKIYPCTMVMNDEKHCLGDVRNGVLSDALSFIDSITSKNTDECASCTRKQFCTAYRCFFINYASTGDYYSPNLVMCNLLNVKHYLERNESIRIDSAVSGTERCVYVTDGRQIT